MSVRALLLSLVLLLAAAAAATAQDALDEAAQALRDDTVYVDPAAQSDVDASVRDGPAQLVGIHVGLRSRRDIHRVVAERLRRLVERVLGGGRRRSGEQQREAQQQGAHGS